MNATQDALGGYCVNGAKRGRASTEYDYRRGGTRVEVKSSQLHWEERDQRWNASWQGIKSDVHDELRLVLYTPTHLYVFVHDGHVGVSTNGKNTATHGRKVQLRGARNEYDIGKYVDLVIRKLGPPCVVYAFADNDPVINEVLNVRKTRTDAVYAGAPLGSLDGKSRGLILEKFCRHTDVTSA